MDPTLLCPSPAPRLSNTLASLGATKTAIVEDGKVDECNPLLDYLRVAVTRQAARSASTLALEWPSMQPPPNPALFNFFLSMLCCDLPDMFNHGSNNPAAANQIAAAVGNLANETHLAWEATKVRQEQQGAGTNIQEFFGEVGVRNLMRLCQVFDQAQLPELHANLAAAPKRQRHGVLQDAITMASKDLQVLQPIFVPPGLVDMVAKQEWTL